uniref:Hepatopoietin-A n=1 Tax=Pygocentrus nattereri TaxID=42514 RepID=A0AAR2INK0_PYGNA
LWLQSAVLIFKNKRHALQDYQKTDGARLVASPDSSFMTKSRKMSVGKCARRCSRSRKLPFTCRAFNFDQNGTKCHLLSFDTLTVGVRTESDSNYDLYEKKDFIKECIIGTGTNYKGRRSVTENGVECQNWALNTPHEHHFLPRLHKQKDLQGNLCRNPDNSTTGPWCFTKNPNIRYQNCNIPQCSEVQCMMCNGESYRGPMDHTESGRECQRWDLEEPHKHLFHPKRYPDKGLKDNYCRNPDGRQRPWCFTTDPNTPWEYCSIKQCDSDNQSELESTTTCFRGNGEGYRGTVAMPHEGLTCQRWDTQFPHSHPFTPQNYRSSLGITQNTDHILILCHIFSLCCVKEREVVTLSEELEGSFCRNPDKDKHGPWCYTNSSLIPWDYCTVKRCDPLPNALPQKAEVPQASCFVHKQVRIVGGGPVPIKEGSWMVSIQKGATHWCGGSLVREEWVLTDRECFSTCVPDLSEYRVWLGCAHLNDSDENVWTRQERRIAHVVCGPEGSGLALLQLAQPALITDHVRIIQLPVAGCRIQEGIICSTYGWGETKDTGHEGTLKSVQLPIVSNERCEQLHRGSLQITSAKVCAGGKRDEGVCEKDYGGPLVCQEKGSKVIVGVSVHGRGCARHNRPGIFVNVAHYTGWIHKVFKTYPYSDFNY